MQPISSKQLVETRGSGVYEHLKELRQLDFITHQNVGRLKIYKNCENLIANFETAKWPPPQKEELEMAENEMPATRNMPGPVALSYLIAFDRVASGDDIYNAQGRKTA